jgi:hypothetical protein
LRIKEQATRLTPLYEHDDDDYYYFGWYGDHGHGMVGMVTLGICDRYGDSGDDVAGIKHGKETSKLKKINIM